MLQVIDDELNSHLADLADELVAGGVSVEAAQVEAAKQFGDHTKIQQDLMALHPTLWWERLHLSTSAMLLFLLSILPVLAIIWLRPHTLLSIRLEIIVLWWIFLAVTGLIVLLNYWVVLYFGLKQTLVAAYTMTIALLASVVITLLLDIDNFEVSLHAVILAGLVAIVLLFTWKRLSLDLKRVVLYSFTVVVVLSALMEHPLFNFLGAMRCLYLTPDTIPLTGALAQCRQIQWTTGILLPLYAIIIFGIPALVHLLWRYNRNQVVPLYRKVMMTGALIMLPVAPTLTGNLNNHGELDIIAWQPVIYKAYHRILGRDPEPKDIEFYATTRSYEHMSRVRQVLYDSVERQLKIAQVFQKTIGRIATTAELEPYHDSVWSIKHIKHDMKLVYGKK